LGWVVAQPARLAWGAPRPAAALERFDLKHSGAGPHVTVNLSELEMHPRPVSPHDVWRARSSHNGAIWPAVLLEVLSITAADSVLAGVRETAIRPGQSQACWLFRPSDAIDAWPAEFQ